MRFRLINEGMWSGRRFAQLPPLAQLLFLGMVSIGNDLGQLKGDPFEFRMKFWPWGLVPIEDIEVSLGECIDAEIVVPYDDDCYFVPGWFKHQGELKYPAKSRLPEIPQELLDKYPEYRDAMKAAAGRGGVIRKEARRRKARRGRANTMDIKDEKRVADALAIEAMAEVSEQNALKVEAIQRMGNAVNHHVSADDMKEYLSILEDTPADQVFAATNQLKRERSYMCYASVVREKAIELFGEQKQKNQRTRDADALVYALAKGHQAYRSAIKALPSKRRGPAVVDVWERLEAMAPRPLSVIVSDIYGDPDYTPERISRTWMTVTRELKKETPADE